MASAHGDSTDAGCSTATLERETNLKKTSSLVSAFVVAIVGCASSEAPTEDLASTRQAYTNGATTSGGTETTDKVTDDFVTSSEKWSVSDCKESLTSSRNGRREAARTTATVESGRASPPANACGCTT
jgi:hypothetical protein